MHKIVSFYELVKKYIPYFINHGNIYIGKLYSFEDSLKILRNSKLIFCASVGREGSGYIANIFSSSNNVLSVHEGRPFCTGRNLINNAFIDTKKDEKIYIKKLRVIAKNINDKEAKTYIETNHMFLKTFGQYIINYTDLEFSVISLRRPIALTVRSFYNLKWFSEKYSRTQNWIYKVSNSSPINREDISINNEIDEILSYILSEKLREVYLKKNLLKKGFIYLPVNIPLSDKDIKNIEDIFKIRLDKTLVSKKVNERKNVKSRNIEIQQIEENISKFLESNKQILHDKYKISFDKKYLYIEDEVWEI